MYMYMTKRWARVCTIIHNKQINTGRDSLVQSHVHVQEEILATVRTITCSCLLAGRACVRRKDERMYGQVQTEAGWLD